MTREFQERAHDVRLPANYRLVLEIVESAGDGVHQSVNDVYIASRVKQPSIGFSTVYRALIRLREANLISEILIPGAAGAVYERGAPEHSHFYCQRCTAVLDLDYQVPPAAIKRIARQQNADVSTVNVSVHGICAACKSRDRSGVRDGTFRLK